MGLGNRHGIRRISFKQLMIFKGERLSLQHHEKDRNHLYSKRFFKFKSRRSSALVKTRDYYTIKRGEIHRMEAGSEDVLVLEASTPIWMML